MIQIMDNLKYQYFSVVGHDREVELHIDLVGIILIEFKK